MPDATFTLDNFMDRYRPTAIDQDTWAAVRDLVAACVALAEPTDAQYARQIAVTASGFAAWAHAQGHRHDEPRRLLTHANVEGFTRHLAEAGKNDRTVATYRSRLRRLGKRADPNGWHVTRRPIVTSTSVPYTADEVEQMLAHLNGLEGSRHRAAAALLYAGLGAGAEGADLRDLTAGDIVRRDGLVIVQLRPAGGSRPARDVPSSPPTPSSSPNSAAHAAPTRCCWVDSPGPARTSPNTRPSSSPTTAGPAPSPDDCGPRGC